MKVTTEPREDCQMGLTIEVEPERVEAAMTAAARRIANKTNIPGFRKGKAPRKIVEQMFGKAAVLKEALDELGNKIYAEALDQAQIEPYGPGQLEDMQTDPQLVLKMLVPLPPKVELGDYRSLREPFLAPAVTDDEIDHQIEHMRERNAIIEPAPEGATVDWGNMVTLAIHATADGKTFIDQKDANLVLEHEHLDGGAAILPGFEEQVIGMQPGEEKVFSLPIPNDDAYGEFKGKTAELKVTLNDLRLRTLPDADDALAQTVGDYETIDALREAIRKDLAEGKQRQAETAYADRAVDKLLETAQVKFPPTMVEQELDAMLERTDKRMRDQGLNLEEYLKMLSKTRDEYRQELGPTAEARLKRGLLLNRIVELEQLDVADAEIKTEIDAISSGYGQRADSVREVLASDQNRRNIHFDLLTRKALDRLSAITRGEAPPLEEPVAAASGR